MTNLTFTQVAKLNNHVLFLIRMPKICTNKIYLSKRMEKLIHT